jgi:hypothetical protein
MPEPFVAPSQSAWIVENDKVIGHVSLGGPTLQLTTCGKTYKFEMHRFLGPCALTLKTEQPTNRDHGKKFWDAIDRWYLGGKLVDGNVCVVPEWCSTCNGHGEVPDGHKVGRVLMVKTCPVCGGKKVGSSQAQSSDVISHDVAEAHSH